MLRRNNLCANHCCWLSVPVGHVLYGEWVVKRDTTYWRWVRLPSMDSLPSPIFPLYPSPNRHLFSLTLSLMGLSLLSSGNQNRRDSWEGNQMKALRFSSSSFWTSSYHLSLDFAMGTRWPCSGQAAGFQSHGWPEAVGLLPGLSPFSSSEWAGRRTIPRCCLWEVKNVNSSKQSFSHSHAYWLKREFF